ncbi:protein Wnt-16-like [Varroa destructor]|uniref:Protein Wnt n=1 Tax=Varroa destructor TaxID=109461 RepID=A0A7M7J735_VARDE|nr:protein Wnt-16-like [Varroa destructor]XP_022645338.1 protein Wnt-16-like [Varroa destructor]
MKWHVNMLALMLVGLIGTGSASSGSWMYLGLVDYQSIRSLDRLAGDQPVSSDGSPLSPQVDPLAIRLSELCSAVPGLVQSQLDLCHRNPHALLAISEGARRGIIECQEQFRHERWNCTLEGGINVFDMTLQRASREAAFIFAVTSAGVVHSVSRACSAGNLTDCGCDPDKPTGQRSGRGWKWGGCSANIGQGLDLAKQFIDVAERTHGQISVVGNGATDSNATSSGSSITAILTSQHDRTTLRTLMNLHNNQAGRVAIRKNMRLRCRCHGISGSCEVKTCWMLLPNFEDIGVFLKDKYDNSIQITAEALKRRKRGKRRVPVSRDSLVHIHDSPDFCERNARKKILGTSGRVCNKYSNGPDSCEHLCCGRGARKIVKRITERCDCQFHWCCYVTCKLCETRTETYICK